ncbi:MAG: hypothetical protein H7Z38_22480 [Rubrivivax sp.]|nr:hypothetical protein [Pyrinomonadaceae bacterium]
MSTVVEESHLLITGNVLSGVLPIPLPQVESDLQLRFDIPAFQLHFAVPITEIDPDMESGRVLFKAAFNDVILVLTAIGNMSEDEDVFKIEHVNLHMEQTEESARADFIISTIRAVLVLADDVHFRIPDVNIDITLRFDEPLLDISQMLRRRQIDYRIMVIEQAIGREFHLPIDISGNEVHDIALAYHAIVEHSFIWPMDTITVFFPSSKEWSDTLLRIRQEASIPIGPDPFSLELFGHKIELGQKRIIIKDAAIENFEIALEELSKNDGHVVPVVIRSMTGQAMYEFFGAPGTLPVMWDSNIKRMAELEPQLDSRLAERYNALAASTLAGLTEKEKEEITTRPELGEAFLIDTSDGE